MKIKLAGINVSTEVLRRLIEELPNEKRSEYREKLTPIILAAAYARISRSPKSISELVEEAIENVFRARKSAQTIMFGMGHHSIADHCFFNFNIEKVSRLAVEEIEKRRLAGYTEKSQRYVTLNGDYIKPKEFSGEDLEKFKELIQLQNQFYFESYNKLFEHLKQKNETEFKELSEQEKKEKIKKLELIAKEDARYCLSLATETQLGCSYDGESLELAIKYLQNSELIETREVASKLKQETKKYQEILQLVDKKTFEKYNPKRILKESYFTEFQKNLKESVKEILNNRDIQETKKMAHLIFYDINEGKVQSANKLISLFDNKNLEEKIIAAIIFSHSKESYEDCYKLARAMKMDNKIEKFFKEIMKPLSEYDKVPREFELGGLIYEIILSASAFAQLKRHRLATILSQNYDPSLNYVIPESMDNVGLSKKLIEICDKSTEMYEKFQKYGKAAEYCLTNAHKKRVLLCTNFREFYHISRTREDKHAQWEIRSIAKEMSNLVKKKYPLISMFLGGKDEFNKIKENIYKD